MSSPQPISFPTTQWTLIAQIKGADPKATEQALEEICRTYRYPLYGFARRFGLDAHDAEDALHDFLLSLLQRQTLNTADEARGRLRSLLMTAFRHFLLTRQAGLRTQRRGGAVPHLSLDQLGDEARYAQEAPSESPELFYDRKWARELLDLVLRKLGEVYESQGRGGLFRALAPILKESGTGRGQNLAALAASLQLSDTALRTALSRLRKDYREMLLAQVGRTLEDPAQSREEAEYLISLFR